MNLKLYKTFITQSTTQLEKNYKFNYSKKEEIII